MSSRQSRHVERSYAGKQKANFRTRRQQKPCLWHTLPSIDTFIKNAVWIRLVIGIPCFICFIVHDFLKRCTFNPVSVLDIHLGQYFILAAYTHVDVVIHMRETWFLFWWLFYSSPSGRRATEIIYETRISQRKCSWNTKSVVMRVFAI